MLKHIIMWDLLDKFTKEEKAKIKMKIKRDLEALAHLKGIISIKVFTEPELTSNCDIMLLSEFESREAFDHYQTHPEHETVKSYLASVRKDRKCFDGAK